MYYFDIMLNIFTIFALHFQAFLSRDPTPFYSNHVMHATDKTSTLNPFRAKGREGFICVFEE
jgi:hypothetical protein